MGFWRNLFTNSAGPESQLRESISQYSDQDQHGILKLYQARMATLAKVNPSLKPMVLASSLPLIAASAKHGFQFRRVLEFWFSLAEKDIDPYYAIQNAIPVIADRFEEPQDFELLLDAIENLVVAVSDLVTRRGAEIAAKHATGSLLLSQANQEAMKAEAVLRMVHEHGVGALAQASVAPETLREFILHGVRLTNRGIDPTDALGSILWIVQVACNAHELETLMDLLDKLISATYTAFPDWGRPLRYGIRQIAESSLDANRVGACLRLACEMMNKGLRPYNVLETGLPHILQAARDKDEFKNWLAEGHRMVALGIDPTEKFLTLIKQPAAREGLVETNSESRAIPGVAGQRTRAAEELAQITNVKRNRSERLIDKGTLLYDRKGLTTSPDLCRIAYWAPPYRTVLGEITTLLDGGLEWVLIADGIASKTYNGFAKGSPVFSPDSARIAFAASRHSMWFVVVDSEEHGVYEGVGTLIFSPNSKRVAYYVGLGDKRSVVVDGQNLTKYDGVSDPEFSPDSLRVAFCARKGNEMFVVVNGNEGKGYELVGETGPVFSPNSVRIVYQGKSKDNWFLSIDGSEIGPFDCILESRNVFSQNSKRAAFAAKQNEQWFAVVDGTQGHLYDQISVPTFSPDSRRVAYWAEKNGKRFIVTDGKQGKPYDDVSYPIFSSDSQRLAYVGLIGHKWYAVLDDNEGGQYDGIPHFPIFSPDSKHLAYVAKIVKKAKFYRSIEEEFLVIDGQRQPHYEHAHSLVFSPDSQQLAYMAVRGRKKVAMVVNGIEGQWYDGMEQGVFSSNSRHLAYRATLERRALVILDGKEGEQFDGFLKSRIIFDSRDTLRYLAYRGKNIYSIEEATVI